MALYGLATGVLRVLVNITHNSIAGCKCVSSFDGVIEILLKCILQSPQYVLDEQRLVAVYPQECDCELCVCRWILFGSFTL